MSRDQYKPHRIPVSLIVLLAIGALFGMALGAYFRYKYSPPLNVALRKSKPSGILTSGPYGYGVGYDFGPPFYMYLVCNVNVVHSGPDKGPIFIAPDTFVLLTKPKQPQDTPPKYRSLAFAKELIPEQLSLLPTTRLESGQTLSGQIVFELEKGTVPLWVEHLPRTGPRIIESPNSMTS